MSSSSNTHTEYTILNVRMTKSQKADLKMIAEREHRTMSHQLRHILEDAVKSSGIKAET